MNALIERKQAKYEQTSHLFWNDGYISQQMLRAHLDLAVDNASRNIDFINRSVEWIVSFANEESKFLDLGCGPGLYTERFAGYGFDVTGVDFSDNSIAYAKEHRMGLGVPVDYLQQDYLKLSVEHHYDVITLIYCDYGALSSADRKVLGSKAFDLLNPGGKLILDVFSIEKYRLTEEGTGVSETDANGFWTVEPCEIYAEIRKYPKSTLLERYIVKTNSDMKDYNLWTTFFNETTLPTELMALGFREFEIYSDVTGVSYDSQSETIAIVLTK